MPFELTISGLSKTYPNGVNALSDVSLTIPTGMFGLLGPNGAGKSTLMRTLATLQEADTGSARLGDIDVLRDKDAVRRTLGYLPQDFGVYPKVSAEDDFLDSITLYDNRAVSAKAKVLPDGRYEVALEVLAKKQKRKIDHEQSAFAIVVDRKPARAGIDPYNKLIDRRPKDNTVAVEVD